MKLSVLNRFAVLRGLLERWSAFPEWVQQFSINVVIGMAIVIWIQMNTDASVVRAQQDRGLDWLSRLVTNTGLAPHPGQPLFMVNVDAETYSQWGEPWLTPADKVAGMIERLLPAEPAQIIVDFDLSRRSDLQPLQDLLTRYLQGETTTHLVFMKTQALQRPAHSVLPMFRASALDSLVAQSDSLHWAAPLFRPDGDGVIRNWQLIVGGCEQGQLALLPSVQLLSVLLSYGQSKADLHAQLAPGVASDCTATPEFAGTMVLGESKTISFAGSDLRHRIIYALPPDPEDGYFSIDWNGLSLPALTKVPARTLLAAEAPAASPLLKGAVVIVGASHRDSGDIHQTPLGAMPGSLILANSITALQGLEQVERPPFWLILLVEFLLVLGTSWLFLVLPPYTATLVSTALIVVVVVPLSLLAFSQGVWLDFALPVLAVQLRSVFFKATDRVQRVRRHGVKGLL